VLTRSPSRLSVLRQPAQQPALPKCLAPPPSLAVRPLAASSLASSAKVPHALALFGHPSFGGRRQVLCRGKPPHRQPRSRLRRHLLAFGTVSATVDVTLSSVQQKSSRQHSEYPAQYPAWLLGLFWRSNRPLPNRLFKGTPTTLASLRKCQARRPLTPALGLSKYSLWKQVAAVSKSLENSSIARPRKWPRFALPAIEVAPEKWSS
jgi:hypothetical protein